ncbi:hypothetical protein JCM14076_28350 [Methylosoma difficile]
MKVQKAYLNEPADDAVQQIVQAIDRDVERGEDILMLGFGTVMLSSSFAIMLPPTILLPLVALAFALSAGFARKNYHAMQDKLTTALKLTNRQQRSTLSPIAEVFKKHPQPPLMDSLNPLLNLSRTWKSVLGGILINPFWMPIFYMMGIQIGEEKNLGILNRTIVELEMQLAAKENVGKDPL